MWFYVCRLNSTVECVPYHLQLSPENALQLIQQYPAAKLSTYICYTDLPLANSSKVMNLSLQLHNVIQAYDRLYTQLRNSNMRLTSDMNSVCDDTLTSLTSYMTLWLTVQTMSPLVIWWMTPVCSVASLWCQQVPWEWMGRYDGNLTSVWQESISLYFILYRVCSWQCITIVEAPATDVCTQNLHPQRQWPTVLMEGF